MPPTQGEKKGRIQATQNANWVCLHGPCGPYPATFGDSNDRRFATDSDSPKASVHAAFRTFLYENPARDSVRLPRSMHLAYRSQQTQPETLSKLVRSGVAASSSDEGVRAGFTSSNPYPCPLLIKVRLYGPVDRVNYLVAYLTPGGRRQSLQKAVSGHTHLRPL